MHAGGSYAETTPAMANINKSNCFGILPSYLGDDVRCLPVPLPGGLNVTCLLKHC